MAPAGHAVKDSPRGSPVCRSEDADRPQIQLPAIGACCYEVGPEVVEAVARGGDLPAGALVRGRRGRRLDLVEANRRQLVRAGLGREAISAAPWCTACSPGRFHSYRRDGAAAGRNLACVGWEPRPGPVP